MIAVDAIEIEFLMVFMLLYFFGAKNYFNPAAQASYNFSPFSHEQVSQVTIPWRDGVHFIKWLCWHLIY